MVRTQIQLTDTQARDLKILAAREGVSMAEAIRQAVQRVLDTKRDIDGAERRRRAIAAAGRFRSDCGDLSIEHDRYLAEAFGQ